MKRSPTTKDRDLSRIARNTASTVAIIMSVSCARYQELGAVGQSSDKAPANPSVVVSNSSGPNVESIRVKSPTKTIESMPTEINNKLIEILRSVGEWPIDPLTGESRSGSYWNHMVDAATIVQQGPPDTIEWTLRQYQAQETESKRGAESAKKLMVLLRIAFDLPEHAPSEPESSVPHVFSIPGLGRTVLNDDLTINKAWPIVWNNGRPELVCSDINMRGTPYDAASEYRQFLKQYSFRDLTSYSK